MFGLLARSLTARRRRRRQAAWLELGEAATLADVAAAKGVTPAALSLAWVLAKGRALGLKGCVPIPGSTKAQRVRDNCAAAGLSLSAAEVAAAEAAVPAEKVVGARYTPGGAATFEQEQNAPLKA